MSVTITDPSTMDPEGIAGGRVFGDLRVTVKRVTLDTSYPTGGYTITPLQLGLPGGKCLFADTASVNDGVASDVACFWDPSTNLLKAYTAAGEVANATNLSTQVAQIMAYGY
jgi:hypothetical protein